MILKQTQAETMKAQLSDLLISISWADLAKRYFNRSGSWLYHKLDGIDGNKSLQHLQRRSANSCAVLSLT